MPSDWSTTVRGYESTGRPREDALRGLTPCGRQILGHPALDWGNGSQIRKDRFQIIIAQLVVPLPRHGGQDRRAVFPNPGAEVQQGAKSRLAQKRQAMVATVRHGASLRTVARRFRVGVATVQLWVPRASHQRLARVDWADRPPIPRTIR